MSKPNIIFIITDQMRGDCVGADGNNCIETPNLDWLGAQGTLFRHAYSAVPSCLPARAIMHTGQNQWHTGVLGMGRGQGPVPNDFPQTLAGELTAAGYRSHMVGKGHFHPQRAMMGFQSHELDESGRQESPNFKDEYRTWFDKEKRRDITPDDHGIPWNSWMARPWHTEEYLHPTNWTMTRAIEFLKDRGNADPFFLNISFARPHSPYVPPAAYFDMYSNGNTPAPYIGDWAACHDVPEDALHIEAWRGKLSDRRIRRGRAGYYGEISFIDAQIGRLRQWLSRYDRDAYANTWWVFTSDHGDMTGDHHLWRKTYAYEGSARVPFIVCPPLCGDQAARTEADEVVELRDIMPTILDIAGVECPDTVDGRSVMGLTKTPDKGWREYIHGEHCSCYAPEQEMQYVTDGCRKLVWLPRAGEEQFFDLETDPGECFNLIDLPERAGEIEIWRGRLASELEARNCGWTKDGRPFYPTADEPLVSPWKDKRYPGKDK